MTYNICHCAAEEKLEEELQLKSVFDYRFNSNKHTRMFLFATQAFWVLCEYVFLVCNLGLFENTEWELIKRGAVSFN